MKHAPVFTLALAVLVSGACKTEARCAHCGMKLDPTSPWNAEIADGANVAHFDTPRCALSTWLANGKHGTVRVQDYYDRTMRPASEVHFVVGSDVVGPMGPALVPVDTAHVAKFEKDHAATRDYALDAIDEKSLAASAP